MNANGIQLIKDLLNGPAAMWSHADITEIASALFLIMAEVNVLALREQ